MEGLNIIRDKAEYMIALVNEFAQAHHLNDRQAYRYMERFHAIDFIDRHYNIAHTQSFEDIVQDITLYCQKQGGGIL
jgi:hypothetical protein